MVQIVLSLDNVYTNLKLRSKYLYFSARLCRKMYGIKLQLFVMYEAKQRFTELVGFVVLGDMHSFRDVLVTLENMY